MTSNLTPVIAAVVAVFGTANIALLGWLVAEQRIMRRDMHRDIGDLRERMARLEGLFEGFTKREAAQ